MTKVNLTLGYTLPIYGNSFGIDSRIYSKANRKLAELFGKDIQIMKNFPIIKRVGSILQNTDKDIVYPEMGLHPQQQLKLMDLIFEDKPKELHIITQSELILLNVQKRVRKGELKKRDVKITYMDIDRKEIEIRLDNEGDSVNINDVPGGLFDEGFDELFLS